MSSRMHRPNSGRSQQRRRGFDDDFSFGGPSSPSTPSPSYNNAGPRPPRQAAPVAASGPEIEAKVKWFNPEKGFGFVEMSDGSDDVFLHANALQTAGEQSVNPGATLRVRVGQGMKGRQVAEVLHVDHSTEQAGGAGGGGGGRRDFGGPPRSGGGMGAPRPPRAGGVGGGFRREHDLSTAVEMNGTVKWYNPEKGFGFVTPENGGKDVFIHASVLERSGLHQLSENQQVVMQVVQGQKGPEAASVRLP